jgi:uroporphyrinogen III methyltransferase/synthase
MSAGVVYLVGAGPGALGLVTLRAKQLIERADILIYDYLVNAEMLTWAKIDAEKIYVGKKAGKHALEQEDINALLIEKARAGLAVVRLKGGDPYVFGRGGEEAQALVAAGVAWEMVPGVSSALAAPAYAGMPLTYRGMASQVTVVTAHEDSQKNGSAVDWPGLAKAPGTKVFLMGADRVRFICERLRGGGADGATPAAIVRWGTWERQESLTGTLQTLPDQVEKKQMGSPAVIVVGEVVTLRNELNWFERQPLFGQRVVVTRSRRQASGLSERLRASGADVLEIPTIRIVPEEASPEWPQPFPLFDWLIFSSQNAVEHFFRLFFRSHADVRVLGTVRIAVVGPGTRRALEAYHLRADKWPEIFTAEQLAQTFSADEVAGRRVCFLHGNRASVFLPQFLRKLGAELTEWMVYRTQPETEDLTGARQRYQEEGAHWLTFASSSAVENWHELGLGSGGGPKPKIASMGPVTSGTLRRLGYDVTVEAKAQTVAALAEAIRFAAAKSETRQL